MTFFYDMNKKLANIADKPETTNKQLNEGAQPAVAEGSTGDYSAKKARAGKDIGKPGKNFEKIAKSAGERYGSKERGEKVAGAVLAKLRGKNESVEEGLGDVAKKVGGAVKKVASKALDTLGHGSDEDMIRDLQKKAGVPQTGKKPQQPVAEDGMEEGVMDWAKEKYHDYQTGRQWNKFGKAQRKGDTAGMQAAQDAAAAHRDKLQTARLARTGSTLSKDTSSGLGQDQANIAALKQKGMVPKNYGSVAEEGGEPMSAKQKAFAKLAPPKDKITFADKIAGAKKEVDEMLGDVAAEAMKSAVGATRKIAGKRYGGAAQKDDEPQAKPAAPRGRGRPKKSTDTEQGAELKPDWSAFGVGKVKLPAHKGNVTKHKLSDKEPGEKVKESATPEDREVLERLMDQAFEEGKNALGNAIQGVLEMMSDGEEELDEKAVSKKQQKFMGMVHAAQKGEKPASKEVAKVAKEMPKKAAKDFAATKHEGLPEKKKPEGKKKKEKTEEAGGVDTPTASSGFGFGKGIYDSMNREIENMIAETMNVSMNMSNDSMGGPTKSLTVTATDEDAEKLGALLRMAGLGQDQQPAGDAYGCEQVDENQPDWPTNTETSNDAMQYSGGINKPKTDVAGDGQSTVPVNAVRLADDTYAEAEEAAIRRMMEMAGIKNEAKKVDEADVEEGNKFTGNLAKARAAGKKEADLDGDGDLEKVHESALIDMSRLWKAYKG